ncbi:WhiB family transcriptional regulator, partial [Nocardiopsis sp. frass1]
GGLSERERRRLKKAAGGDFDFLADML